DHKGLNAFTYGPNNKNARIVIHEDLLRALPNYALKGVLAHELGHIKNEDFRLTSLIIFMPQAALTLMLLTFAIPLFILLLLIIGLFLVPFMGSDSKDKDGSNLIGSVFIGIFAMVYVIYHIGIWSFLLALFVIPTYLWYCRTREYLADKRTVDAGLSPFCISDALVIINYYTYGYNERHKYVTENSSNIVKLNNNDPFVYCMKAIMTPIRRLSVSSYNGIGNEVHKDMAERIYTYIVWFFENYQNKKRKSTSFELVGARFKELVDQGILIYPPDSYTIVSPREYDKNIMPPKHLAKGEEYNLKSYIYDRIREGSMKQVVSEKVFSILSTHPTVLARIINVMNAEKEKGNGKKGFSS
ncbi:MAG: M48 family metalloprotease, partial [Thermodesulfovibrionales bacterium]|nr:M48 family metalloprotease [Thermodesulfovibrionales bacterium]